MSNTQNSLFDRDQAPMPASANNDLIAQATSVATSPLQKEFARLLKKIDTTGQQLQDMESMFATYRSKFANTLKPLTEKVHGFQKQMVLFLHERLQQTGKGKNLTPKQRQGVERMIVGISQPLAMAGDEQMQDIHDRYSQESMDDIEQDHNNELREMMGMMGVPMDDLDENANAEVLIKRLQESAMQAKNDFEAKEQKRAEKAKARKAAKAKTDPKLQAKLDAQQETEQDAQSALRNIYRQLARQLHPDRAESDAQRETNHDLMSQVNAAYEKQDLLALLKLQLRAQQIDAGSLNAVAEDKLRSWNKLLKDQAKQLEADLDQIQSRIAMHFQLPPYMAIVEPNLENLLKTQVRQFESDLNFIQADLIAVQDDAGLKRWVKEQIKMTEDDDIEALSEIGMLGSIFDDMMREAQAPKKRKKR